MARVIGLLFLLGVAWLLLKRALDGPRGCADDDSSRAPPRFEKTERCDRCGVYRPKPTAGADSRRYGCDEPGCPARPRAPRAPDEP